MFVYSTYVTCIIDAANSLCFLTVSKLVQENHAEFLQYQSHILPIPRDIYKTNKTYLNNHKVKSKSYVLNLNEITRQSYSHLLCETENSDVQYERPQLLSHQNLFLVLKRNFLRVIICICKLMMSIFFSGESRRPHAIFDSCLYGVFGGRFRTSDSLSFLQPTMGRDVLSFRHHVFLRYFRGDAMLHGKD